MTRYRYGLFMYSYDSIAMRKLVSTTNSSRITLSPLSPPSLNFPSLF
jgi:hypothetical protein